ncbi:peptidoglycan-binding domain-containing protein [Streptomyces atroolivaceus]|uniref:peptidoglycan-binding domain-containing protein n=1 Tax=Streptomyces atroolivaceus TaxID=66869 RepID=UPI0036CAF50F
MRALTKTFVSATTAIGIAVGAMTTAGTAMAAPAPTAVQQQAVTGAVSAAAPVNLGLTRSEARNWQCWLSHYGYAPGVADGYLGVDSWKAAQRMLNSSQLYYGDYKLVVDGDVGTATIRALQRFLIQKGADTLDVTGVAGPLTKAEFAIFANRVSGYC